jgi:dolichol-phosphate mannosyltransferase
MSTRSTETVGGFFHKYIAVQIKNMKHVILVPTYNESENIEKIISAIMRSAPEVFIKVIDDNSPDGTGAIVSRLALSNPHVTHLSRPEKEGLGKAYSYGFRELFRDQTATHVIMMDADMSHDPEYLPEMIEKSKQFDLVVGSRYVSGGKTVGWETWRRALSFFGNVYARVVTCVSIHDLTGGFNCISLSALRRIDCDKIGASGYAFQIELKYLLYRNGATVKEIPITFANRAEGESKISNHIVREGILAPWKMVLNHVRNHTK